MSEKPTTPLRGNALLAAVVNQIIAEPERWDQVDYHSECGTKHCVAGWAQILGGRRADSKTAHNDAEALLELDRDEADFLFYGEREFHEIYAFAKAKLSGKKLLELKPSSYAPLTL